jgi:uncharacterized circularly permuted ATP-grasp superfamily protein/uncharacterized alpha-E superfamily protein
MEPTQHLTPTGSAATVPVVEADNALPLWQAVGAHAGQYDELRARLALDDAAARGPLAPGWAAFFRHMGSSSGEIRAALDARMASLQRMVRDNGVTYNVYADASGPQRPWSLDLFPVIVSARSWEQIETGVLQRMKLLDRLMADVYGPQEVLKSGLLPPALVQGHPGYLRSLHGVKPLGGTHLHIAAFDLARGPDGQWWLVSQRTQAPSGLGYLLENRLTTARLFPQAFAELQVQRLAGAYRALVQSIKRMSPARDDAHIALLTSGPYNETYFEHAYLARYLGVTLVQGNDLTVRGDRLFLKTLRGLEPVHGLIKRLDDAFLDPLELQPDSTLGVPGLLQVVRAGQVVLANAPGSAFLESSALLGFLPALSRRWLGETLRLPAVPTWWCGERAAFDEVVPTLREGVIKATYAGFPAHGAFPTVDGRTLSARERDEWIGRILRNGAEHTVQSRMALSSQPVWSASATAHQQRHPLEMRPMMLRVFALSDGPGQWRVLPGGLARLGAADSGVVAMQRGGSSADVWVQVNKATGETVDTTTLVPPRWTADSLATRHRAITSRAAENLYWLGRYTERAENSVRLATLVLQGINGEDANHPALLDWFTAMARGTGLVLPQTPAAAQGRRVFERALVAGLTDAGQTTSVGHNLRSIRQAASAVRERLSHEQWLVIERAERRFAAAASGAPDDTALATRSALQQLDAASIELAAMTGAQTDRMTRDDGWRLLSCGRLIERLGFLSNSLMLALTTQAVHEVAGFESVLALFDSTITYRAQFQQNRDLPALVDLLVLNRDNPRSLGWVAHTLRGRLSKLAGAPDNAKDELARGLPAPADWPLGELVEADAQGTFAQLHTRLAGLQQAVWLSSELIGQRYFAHTVDQTAGIAGGS